MRVGVGPKPALVIAALAVTALTGCVSKGTHSTALADLATARSEGESLQSELAARNAELATLREQLEQAEATEAELRREVDRLEVESDLYREESERLDGLRLQAQQEIDRLEIALRQRGGEFRELQQRLDALGAIEQEIRDRNRIYEDVIGRFRSLIDGGQLSVAIVRGRLAIQLPQDILFESGSAVVGREGRQTLSEVGAVLADLEERRFQVEGHTDNVPIATSRFASNWELSSARALSVVQILLQQGVEPANLSGAGYGEYQPVTSNDDAESRRRNRRIEIIMLPNLDVIADAQSEDPS